jgi:hypothetical protein
LLRHPMSKTVSIRVAETTLSRLFEAGEEIIIAR